MIELKGTEKQIKWAEWLRDKFLTCLKFKEEAIKVSHPNSLESEGAKAWFLLLEEVTEIVKKEEDSKWFIGKKGALDLYGDKEYWDINFNILFASNKSYEEYEENIKKHEKGLKLEERLTSNTKFMDEYRKLWAETSPDERKKYHELDK